jgi:hypothetical protein
MRSENKNLLNKDALSHLTFFKSILTKLVFYFQFSISACPEFIFTGKALELKNSNLIHYVFIFNFTMRQINFVVKLKNLGL